MSNSLTPSGIRPLEQLKVAELREELRKRGLNQKGVKKELLERLEEAVSKEGQSDFHSESSVPGEGQRVSSEGMPGTLDSDGEGEEFDKATEEAPAPYSDSATVLKCQSDATVSDRQAVSAVVVETTSQATEVDPAFQEREPQGMAGVIIETTQANELEPAISGREPSKGLDNVDSGSDGIVSDEGGCVKSSLTDVAANIGTCVQGFVDNEDGSGVNPEVSQLPTQLPESLPGDIETMKQKSENDAFDLKAGQVIAEVAPSAQTLDVLNCAKASQDVEMSEAFNTEKVDARLPESEKLASISELAESQHTLDHVPTYGTSESNSFPVTNYPTDIKPEIDVLETHVENRQIYIETVNDEQMVLKVEPVMNRISQSIKVEYENELKPEVFDKPQYEKFDDEMPDTDSVRVQRIKEEEHIKPEGRAGELTREWAEDMKVDKTSNEVNAQQQAGQKRRDDDRDIKQQEPTKRQRRWNSGNKLVGELSKPLTTGTVKEIISLENKEVPLTLDVSPKVSTPKILATSRPSPPANKVEWFGNGEKGKERIVPPPARPPTTSLKIERFIRPFTLKAVNDLLSQYGRCAEFWMDQIKTHCFVTYSAVDEAVAARNALYDLQWPPSFGNQLVVEFVDPFEVKSRCEASSEKAAVTPVTTPRGGAPLLSPTQASPPAVPVLAQTVPLPPPPPLRERPILPPKKEPEPPVPTLDDLFKKTKAKPHIYYLPLTDDQVAVKLAARSKEQFPKNNSSSAKA